ncbi:transmembrane protein, putative (macronuclear) [Tetrahymena thermophila SB210]|uniref:Transmembrane protein, putative n=1 Tax=Tetrahymena thermophila (strain SB210) TaxID=312017 RepID=W7X609_TETTS|nr:transmembrane protein, putative [Tetrahymena thermophila SB210]EWS72822.1 transmembrane protein, putative [Tetrahymena thermophila SB210]|eukprot:XP_012654648.1 transmembrane protein, putative [Tetrahymena thermophila SB210]
MEYKETSAAESTSIISASLLILLYLLSSLNITENYQFNPYMLIISICVIIKEQKIRSSPMQAIKQPLFIQEKYINKGIKACRNVLKVSPSPRVILKYQLCKTNYRKQVFIGKNNSKQSLVIIIGNINPSENYYIQKVRQHIDPDIKNKQSITFFKSKLIRIKLAIQLETISMRTIKVNFRQTSPYIKTSDIYKLQFAILAETQQVKNIIIFNFQEGSLFSQSHLTLISCFIVCMFVDQIQVVGCNWTKVQQESQLVI